MSGTDFIVRPMSWDAIEMVAGKVRSNFGLTDIEYFPVIDFVERVLDHQMNAIEFLVEDRHAMGHAEGFTDPNGEFIILRDDVYEDGIAGNGRARFTAAHELGHFFLHTKVPLARASPGQTPKPYMLTEPQANQFAVELLMPPGFFSRSDTPETVMSRHGVSFEAAKNRLNYLGTKGKFRR